MSNKSPKQRALFNKLHELEVLNSKINAVTDSVQPLLKDTEIPVDERFLAHCNFNYHEKNSCYLSFYIGGLDDDQFHAEMCFSKNQSYDAQDVMGWAESQVKEGKATDQDLNELKEGIIKSGYAQWVFDW